MCGSQVFPAAFGAQKAQVRILPPRLCSVGEMVSRATVNRLLQVRVLYGTHNEVWCIGCTGVFGARCNALKFFIFVPMRDQCRRQKYLNIMVSKILIDADEDFKPVIRVVMPKVDSDDLRDKTVKRFFEELGHDSSFVGVINERGGDGTERVLIPMTLLHAFEWLERAALERCKDDASFVLVSTAFDKILNEAFGINRAEVVSSE